MIKKSVILFLKIYRKIVSPIYPASCRYYPTCSHYAIESVEKYGVLKGLAKAVWRILRCNPFSKGGIDHP
jgi:hypothetical protein